MNSSGLPVDLQFGLPTALFPDTRPPQPRKYGCSPLNVQLLVKLKPRKWSLPLCPSPGDCILGAEGRCQLSASSGVFRSPEDKCSVRSGLGHSACPCSVGGRGPGAPGRWPASGRAPGTGGSGLVPPRRMRDRLHWTLGPGGGGGDRLWKK